MKYWWLEKYKELEVKRLPELFFDIQFFLTMPKNYESIYKQIETLPISKLSEEEMGIVLYTISKTKNVKDNTIRQVIQNLLLVPDTSLPISDYTLSEIIKEINQLKERKATVEKLSSNNVAACYSCLNVFYVDKIHSVNKKGQCLCPFCGKNKLYFDNELIPMNYSFLFHSRMVYGISELGCDFTKLKKIGKKGILLLEDKNQEETSDNQMVNQTLKPFQKKLVKGEDESKLIKLFYDYFFLSEKKGSYETTLFLEWKGTNNTEELSYLLLLSCFYVLGNFFYLKRIVLVIENKELRSQTEQALKRMLKS